MSGGRVRYVRLSAVRVSRPRASLAFSVFLAVAFFALGVCLVLWLSSCGGSAFGIGPDPDAGPLQVNESGAAVDGAPSTQAGNPDASEDAPSSSSSPAPASDGGTNPAVSDSGRDASSVYLDASYPPEAGAVDAGPPLCCAIGCGQGSGLFQPGTGWTCAGPCVVGGTCTFQGTCGMVVRCP